MAINNDLVIKKSMLSIFDEKLVLKLRTRTRLWLEYNEYRTVYSIDRIKIKIES